MFRTVLRLSFVAALAAAAAFTPCGCSTMPSQVSSGSAPTGPSAGSVGIIIVASESISSFSYTITGPGGFTRAGTFDVATSPTLSAVIGGLPPGTGYTISVSGTGSAGTACSGSAPFDVTAGVSTTVTLGVDCKQAPKTGSVSVNGAFNVCPILTALSASPSMLFAGSSSALVVAASDADAGPSPLAYHWTTTLGTFSNPSATNPTFTCTAPGTAAVTVTASDGDPQAGCAATATFQIVCAGHLDVAAEAPTATKLKHLVVIFDENISYDHYFGTYPTAANPPGDPGFVAGFGTGVGNGLSTPLDVTKAFAPLAGVDLLGGNPNALAAANGTGAVNPFRLGPAQAATADQGHNYKPEQAADDNLEMDLFPASVGTAGPPPGSPAAALTTGLVMGYYDGNTVMELWNLAQQYAMNDNSWSTVFGPSTPGAINLISGQTNGFLATNKDPATMSASHVTPDGNGGWTLIGDTDPLDDVCSTASDQNSFAGKNVGDLLNAKGVSWGWFEGGFDLTLTNANLTTGCARSTPQTVAGAASTSNDYIPHHQPFQYYPSTSNPTHARPSSVAAIGRSVETDGVTPEPANHQYDSHDFFDALGAGNLPSVTYLKAPAFQDGHAGYSNPLDEQNWLTQVVAAIQATQEWQSTAIVIAYDDSDGWYDHQAPPIVNPSTGVADVLNGAGVCNQGLQQGAATPATPLLGNDGHPALGRCGYGTRMPLLVVSPCSKRNFIDHTLTDQTSILRFIEDNWLAGQRIQSGGSFDTLANPITNMMTL